MTQPYGEMRVRALFIVFPFAIVEGSLRSYGLGCILYYAYPQQYYHIVVDDFQTSQHGIWEGAIGAEPSVFPLTTTVAGVLHFHWERFLLHMKAPGSARKDTGVFPFLASDPGLALKGVLDIE